MATVLQADGSCLLVLESMMRKLMSLLPRPIGGHKVGGESIGIPGADGFNTCLFCEERVGGQRGGPSSSRENPRVHTKPRNSLEGRMGR